MVAHTVRLLVLGGILLGKLGLCLVDELLLALVLGMVFPELVGGRDLGLVVDAVDDTESER